MERTWLGLATAASTACAGLQTAQRMRDEKKYARETLPLMRAASVPNLNRSHQPIFAKTGFGTRDAQLAAVKAIQREIGELQAQQEHNLEQMRILERSWEEDNPDVSRSPYKLRDVSNPISPTLLSPKAPTSILDTDRGQPQKSLYPALSPSPYMWQMQADTGMQYGNDGQHAPLSPPPSYGSTNALRWQHD